MATGLLKSVIFARSNNHIVTICGWSPGIRLLVAAHHLPCGCLAGIYHTLSEEIVEIVDATVADCPHHHDRDLVLRRQKIASVQPMIAPC
jgi:hypothetical protein